MKSEKAVPVIVVVDMLYDFIDGTLACLNSESAVKEAVKFINKHDDMVDSLSQFLKWKFKIKKYKNREKKKSRFWK